MKLTSSQKLALRLFAGSPLSEKFYWTGGTALAYHYLHHRMSDDLDFFSDTQFEYEPLYVWSEAYREKAGFRHLTTRKIFDRHEFVFENGKQLKIEFVYYNHGRKTLGKREIKEGILVDSLIDMAANKTLALIDRDDPKDIFDLYYFMTREHMKPKQLLDLVQKKFGAVYRLDLFWGEAVKMSKRLFELKPYIPDSTEEDREKLLTTIVQYIQDRSHEYVYRTIPD